VKTVQNYGHGERREYMKTFTQNHVVTGLILIIFGIILLIWPGSTLDIVCKIVGVAVLIAGIVGVAEGLAGKRKDPAAVRNFAGNVAAVIVGILLIAFSGAIVSVLPFVLGILIVIYSAVEIFGALKADGGIQTGRLIMAVIELIIGILIMANPFSTVTLLIRILGIGMIFGGVTQIMNKN